MAENRGDSQIERFSGELASPSAMLRVQAAANLIRIGGPRAMGVLAESLKRTLLQAGGGAAQIEAFTLIQGRCSDNLFGFFEAVTESAPEGIDDILKNLARRKLPLEEFRETLFTVGTDESKPMVSWYALVALVELGDRTQEVLNELIRSGDAVVERVAEIVTEARNDHDTLTAFLWIGILSSVKEETLRTLSQYRGIATAKEAILRAVDGAFLQGNNDLYVIYALGALGDPSTLERLQDFASAGSSSEIRSDAKLAINLFGREACLTIRDRARSARQ